MLAGCSLSCHCLCQRTGMRKQEGRNLVTKAIYCLEGTALSLPLNLGIRLKSDNMQ